MKMGRSFVSSSCPSVFLILSNFLIQLLQISCSLRIPQNLASAHQLCNHEQSNGLLYFKRTIQYGAPLPQCYTVGANLDNWKEGSDCCSWDGVTCNKVSGDVIKLDLSCSGIHGSVESNSTLFHLPHLQSLNLAYNDFTVFQIYSNFGNELKYLNLSACLSSGFVPSEVANLSNLETLDISSISNFSILVQKLTKLQILILSSVLLDWNMLKEITNLTNLIHLDLSYCRLEGELSSVNFSDLEELEYLNLDHNLFRGGFPISLGNLTKLSYLSLSDNQFTGHIPSITNGFQALSTMKLDLNRFGGTIPSWLFNLSSLQVLDVSQNLLVGPLPSNNITWPHSKLTHLALSNNLLTGTIPPALFALPSLVSFFLASNNLTGYVGEFQSLALQEINLSFNSLKGGNFSCISKLVNLQELFLLYNNLEGSFDLDLLSSLGNLKFVSLSGNILLSPNSRNDTAYLPLPKLTNLWMEDCNAKEIPFFVRNLVGMDALSLNKNNIHGLLPEWLRNISIPFIQLSNNSITGGLQNLPLGCEADLSFNKLRSLPSNLSMNNLYMSHNLIESGIENLPQITHGDVDLSFNRIRGTLPANISVSYLDLSHNWLESGVENLQSIVVPTINLSFNKLRGAIPSNISVSWLDLSHNSLERGAEFLHSFGLRSLDLSFNNLQGTLPIPLGDNKIFEYFISNNKLSGNIHPSMCDLGPFQQIDLSYNNLSGKIPDCLLEIPSLFLVNLRGNNFSGIIPQTISNSLIVLDLSNNHLQGIIPRSLANCQVLLLLDLSSNLINDMFPTWLEDMQSLQVLMLGSNRLYGNLSSSKSIAINVSTAFAQLRVMDVSYNNLLGILPSHYFQSWTSMMKDDFNEGIHFDGAFRYEVIYRPVKVVNKGMEMEFTKQLIKVVDFSNNKFEGVIPESIGNLSFLMALNLSSNHFSGEIPSSLGRMVQLNFLDLSNNNLSGRIPGTLSSLTFLGAFNVSENNLEGQIPQGGQLTTFSDDSFKGNPGLCGIPLTTGCGEQLVPHAPPLFEPPEEEDEESFVDGFTWESVVIGYGCGFFLGILGGVLILMRYQEFVFGIFNIRLLWRIKRSYQR